MKFYVGQKVVAVEFVQHDPSRPQGPKFDPKEVYVVDGVVEWRGIIGLLIRGMPSPHVTGAYRASAFRPLIDTTKQVEAIKSFIAPIFEGKEVEMVR